MVWSYTGDPNSSPIDAVRFYVQDTIQADPQVSDEEIEFLLGMEGDDEIRTAARTAEIIAAKYARQVDKSVGGLSLSAGSRQDKYEKLAAALWARTRNAGASLPFAYAGGISQTDKDSRASDTDRVEPAFTRTLHDFVSLPEVDANA